MSEDRSFSHLVLVGASAGGVEALSELVSTLPDDFPAPIVAVQHLNPDRESHLRDILTRRSTLPVRTLEEHNSLPLESGVVFVVPADRHVSVTDTEVCLQEEEDEHGRPKPSIDLVFESAAEVYGDRLVAVVMTGTGSDGSDGARAVKRAGGTVIIQDPATAAHPGMPQSLAPSNVDIVVDLGSIGRVVHELLSGIEVPTEPDEKRKVQEFLAEVRDSNGIDFRSYKTPTIMRRLQRRIVATGSGDLAGYRTYLGEKPEEYQNLVNAFLIKVTEFFRDAALFEFLRRELVPEIIEKARENGNQLRIWSAGCATGEEAYSLAILVSEALGDELEHFAVRIFATDLDEAAVDFARHGVYSKSAVNGLPEDLKERYFVKADGTYRVKKQVRGMIVFGQHDLAQRAPFPRTDLVVCRNVLIYFTSELQKRALQLFAYSLKDGGALILGKSETPSPLGEFFSPWDKQNKVYRRRGERFLMPAVSSADPTPLPSRNRSGVVPARTTEFASAVRERREAREERGHDDIFLQKFPVGVVVVDRRYDILSINAAARRLLSISDPAVGEDLLHMIQGAHYAEIRSALDTAFETGESTGVEDFAIEDLPTGEQRYLRIACHPRLEPTTEFQALSIMLVVSDVTDLVSRRLELEDRLESVEEKLDDVAAAAAEERGAQDTLKQRLVDTNQRLIESNGELTSLNEELQTTNEQYLISNEEAQSATEEVETLNEELQATNEELETLNEELQATIEELNTTNEDLHARGAELQALAAASETHYQSSEDSRRRLQNLLSQVPSMVAIVRGEGHTVQFMNAPYARLLGQPEEQLVGKPVSEVFAQNTEVLELLNHVYETGTPGASENPARFDRARDGLVEDTTFDFVYQPLRTLDGAIDGVMIQGFDNTDTPPENKPNGSFPHIPEEPKRLISALASMPDAVLVVDGAGEPLFVNEAFEEMFGEDSHKFVAYSLESGEDLAPDGTPQARASKGEEFRMEFLSRAADGEKRRFEATGRATDGGKGGVVVIREVLS